MPNRVWVFLHFDLIFLRFSTLKVVFTASLPSQEKKYWNFLKTQFSTINFKKISSSSPTALCTELFPSSCSSFFVGNKWIAVECLGSGKLSGKIILRCCSMEAKIFLPTRKLHRETNLRVNATIEREILRMRADFSRVFQLFLSSSN